MASDLGPLIRTAREYCRALVNRGATRTPEDWEAHLPILHAAEKDYLEVANRIEVVMALAYMDDE